MCEAGQLAAGKGTRLGKHTCKLPKGMLRFLGKPLLQHQVDAFRCCDIERVVVVGGYRAEALDADGIVLYANEPYETTHMVESLMCARRELEGEVLVSYADILFEDRVFRHPIDSSATIAVTVDFAWKDYWMARYGDPSFDSESLRIGPAGEVPGVPRSLLPRPV